MPETYEIGWEGERGVSLTAREREVLSLIEEVGMTPSEIGEDLGMTRQRISAILASLERKGAATKKNLGPGRGKSGRVEWKAKKRRRKAVQ